jgi:hypothetical protein
LQRAINPSIYLLSDFNDKLQHMLCHWWHGYRSDSRYLVFQCLEQTLGLETVKWRVLDRRHKQRNFAEYEGYLEIAPQLLKELIEITEELLQRVESLGNISDNTAW